MPKHVIQRTDEIPTAEWEHHLDLASKIDYANAHQIPPFQLWLVAVLAIDWLTGKRINEILRLKRKDISNNQHEIKIKFLVGKKRSRGTPIEMQPYQKARNIAHKAVPYILKYLQEYDNRLAIDTDIAKYVKDIGGYLFPAPSSPRTKTVNTTFTNGKGEKETRAYTYEQLGGYIKEENAFYWLQKINAQVPPEQRIYFHYGRHSIGIKMAYQGRSPYQIAEILDETVDAALQYTKHASGYSSEWTKETE
jgi:integrase